MNVEQAAPLPGAHSANNDEVGTALPIPSLPYGDFLYTLILSSAGSDPVHSCTSKSDYNTAWYTYSPTQSGTISVTATGRDYDTAGDSGLVITAYPLQTGSIGGELTCAASPAKTGVPAPLTTSFNVKAGLLYAIEISTPNDSVGGIEVGVQPVPGVSISPRGPQVLAGETLQLTANISGSQNTAVRWSISPVQAGSIFSRGPLQGACRSRFSRQGDSNSKEYRRGRRRRKHRNHCCAAAHLFPGKRGDERGQLQIGRGFPWRDCDDLRRVPGSGGSRRV